MRVSYLHIFADFRVVLFFVLLGSGCVSYQQQFGVAKSGIGDILIVKPLSSLKGYQQVHVEPVQNAVGDNLSPRLLEFLNEKSREAIYSLERFSGEGKALVVHGTVIHIFRSPLRSYIVVQVELIDATDGKSLGTANVTGFAEKDPGMTKIITGAAQAMRELLREGI